MKRLLLYVVALLLISSNIYAQIPQYFTTGGSVGNAFPFNAGTGGSNRVQWLYYPTSFTSLPPKGFITRVYLKAQTPSSGNAAVTGVSISLGPTSITTFPGTTWQTGLTQVVSNYSGTVTILNGWFYFDLPTPYYYDNTQNLIFDVQATSTGITVLQNSTTPNGRIWGNYMAATGAGSGAGLVDFGIDIFAGFPCTDTPKTELSAPIKICKNDSFTVQPAKFFADATYQYQYSYNGINWSNFVGSAGMYGEIQDAITKPKWYRCKIFCNANPNASYVTKPVFVDIASFYYCYCKNKATTTSGMDIGNFKVANLPDGDTVFNVGIPIPETNNTKANKVYTSYMDSVNPVIFYRNKDYIFLVKQVNTGSSLPTATATVFLDWNRDGVYDMVTERVISQQTGINGEAADTFRIPADASVGLTGLRVILGTINPADPCGTYTGEGETEDYLAEIRWDPCTGPVKVGEITGASSVCVGYDYLLTNTSYEDRMSGFSRTWHISGDNVTWFNINASKDKDTLMRVFNGQPVYYKVRAVCENTDDTTYTTPFFVNLKEGYKCYCFSQAIGGILKDSSDVGGFTLASVTHTDGGTHLLNARAVQKRSDYTDDAPIDVDVDSTYAMTVFHTLRSDIHGDAKITVFMDFNNNNQYDIPEDLIYTGYTTVGNFTLIDNVKVKATAILNVPTGLRVILNNNIAPNDQSDKACGVYTSGETEDYMITFRKKGFTGVGTVGSSQQVSIYPNPTSGKFNLKVNSATEIRDLKVSVTNVTGQQIQQHSYTVNGNEFSKELDMSSEAKGVYFVEINTDGKRVIERLAIK